MKNPTCEETLPLIHPTDTEATETFSQFSPGNNLKKFMTESTRKSSNIYLSWTKIEYQNNLNPIALFSTLNKR